MRYIFVDEAGTSAREPVTVVVGIIANADEHIMSAEALAQECIGAVPARHKTGFVFHATEIFGSKKYQEDWSLTDRLQLLRSMMSIPRQIGMAVSVSAMWRKAVNHDRSLKLTGLTQSQFEHLLAFQNCIVSSDRSIRNNAGPREVATVVAEKVPEMERFLKGVPKYLRNDPYYLPQGSFRWTPSEVDAGFSTQSGDYRVTRIRNSVHFVEKAEDPLVQIADACAYGFRRYFAGEKFGQDFADSILGSHERLRDFASPASSVCFWFRI